MRTHERGEACHQFFYCAIDLTNTYIYFLTIESLARLLLFSIYFTKLVNYKAKTLAH